MMVLSLKGNHMVQPPTEVCNISPEAVLFFLKHMLQGFSAWETMVLLNQHLKSK